MQAMSLFGRLLEKIRVSYVASLAEDANRDRAAMLAWEGKKPPEVPDLATACDGDPWMLYCAMDAHRKTYSLDFDTWWRLSGDRWLRGVQKRRPATTNRELKNFLRAFAVEHAAESSQAVSDAAALRSGQQPLCVLTPSHD